MMSNQAAAKARGTSPHQHQRPRGHQSSPQRQQPRPSSSGTKHLGNLSSIVSKLHGLGDETKHALLETGGSYERTLVLHSPAGVHDGSADPEDAPVPLLYRRLPMQAAAINTPPFSGRAVAVRTPLSSVKEHDSSDSLAEDPAVPAKLLTPATSPDIESQQAADREGLPIFVQQYLQRHQSQTNVASSAAAGLAPPRVESAYLAFASDGDKYRIWLLDQLKAPRLSTVAQPIELPWDEFGKYRRDFYDSKFQAGSEYRNEIAAYHLFDRELQLQTITALFDHEYLIDEQLRSGEETKAVAQRPIHLFIDMSNINAGFHNHICKSHQIRQDPFSKKSRFFFEGFQEALVRRRPCAKRILAGSYRDGRNGLPAFAQDAQDAGYETNILQRVPRLNPPAFQNGSGGRQQPHTPYRSATVAGEENYGFREQCVDEILHLKMLQSILDCEHEPATLVLATGDASEAEFSDGFYQQVLRALNKGWHVEVAAFLCNMSQTWRNQSLTAQYPGRYRVVELDRIAEELMDTYLR